MTGTPPATAASKHTVRSAFRAASNTSAAGIRQERLVRGHDVLTGRERVQNDLLRNAQAADQFDDDVNVRITDRGFDIGGDDVARDERIARFGGVADHHAPQGERSPGPLCDAVGVREQHVRHPAAYSSAADECDAQRVAHGALPR